MARAPDERYDKAYELYKQGIKLVEIASQLNLPEGTVRRWKSTHKWDSERSEKKSERSGKKERKVKNDKKPIAKEIREVLENINLTDKQRLFCLYYSTSFNATRSYQKAYKCSYETALRAGPELLGNLGVREQITKLKEERYAKALLTPGDIFQKYMDIAFADITDFLEFGTEKVPVMAMYGPVQIKDENTGEKKTLTKVINTVKFKKSDEVDGSILSEVKQGKDGASIKLSDRMKALDWLTAHMDMATELQRLEMAKLKYEVSQLSGGNDGNTGIKDFLKAVKPTQEDIEAMFNDEVIEDAETNKKE